MANRQRKANESFTAYRNNQAAEQKAIDRHLSGCYIGGEFDGEYAKDVAPIVKARFEKAKQAALINKAMNH